MPSCDLGEKENWFRGEKNTRETHLGVSKNRGTPKWMEFLMENPIKMDDLGVPPFSETPIYFQPFIGSPIASFITTTSGGPTLGPAREDRCQKIVILSTCQPSSDSKVATTWKHVDPRWPLMIWKSKGTHPMPRFTQEIASRLKGLTTILPYKHWGGTLRLDSHDLSWTIRTEFIILETTVKCKYTSGHISITLLNLKLRGFWRIPYETYPLYYLKYSSYYLGIFLQLHPSRWMFPKIVVPPNHPC